MPQNDRMDDVLDRLKVALADRYRIERELGTGGSAAGTVSSGSRGDGRT